MTLLFNPNVIGAGLGAGFAADQDIQALTEKMRQREEARFLREYNTYNDLFAKDRYNKAINDGLGPQQAAQAMLGANYAGLAPGLKASNDLAGSAAAGYENAREVEQEAARNDGYFSPFKKGDKPTTIGNAEYFGGNPTIVANRRYDSELEANKTEAAKIRLQQEGLDADLRARKQDQLESLLYPNGLSDMPNRATNATTSILPLDIPGPDLSARSISGNPYIGPRQKREAEAIRKKYVPGGVFRAYETPQYVPSRMGVR